MQLFRFGNTREQEFCFLLNIVSAPLYDQAGSPSFLHRIVTALRFEFLSLHWVSQLFPECQQCMMQSLNEIRETDFYLLPEPVFVPLSMLMFFHKADAAK